MSLASFYNRLEKKYRFFGEGPFTALTSWLGEVIVRMDEPPVKKQTAAEKLAAELTVFYEARLNEALAIEDREKKIKALKGIGESIDRRKRLNNDKLLDKVIVSSLVSAIVPVAALTAFFSVITPAVPLVASVIEAMGIVGIVALGFDFSDTDAAAKFKRLVQKKFGGKELALNGTFEKLLKKASQELEPIEAEVRAEVRARVKASDEAAAKKRIVDVKAYMREDGGLHIFTDKNVQVKPAAAFPSEISKDFNAKCYGNGAAVQELADGSFVVYTNGTVKVERPKL